MCNTNDTVSPAVDDADVNNTTTSSNNKCELAYSPRCYKTHSVSLIRMLKYFEIFGFSYIIFATNHSCAGYC